MDTRTQAAYTAAGDSLKQVLTLSTVLLGFEITFAKDLVLDLPPLLIDAIWTSFFAAIFFGVLGLLALTGRLGRADRPPLWWDTYLPSIRWTSAASVLFFILGVGGTFGAGILALHRSGGELPGGTIRYPFYWAPYLAAPVPPPASTVTIQLPQCNAGTCCGTHPPPARHHVKPRRQKIECVGEGK